MRRLANIALDGLRVAVVTGALLALLISGAGAAHRLFSEQMSAKTTESVSVSDCFDGKPDPDQATGGMATGSHPSTEQSFWIQGNPGLPVGSDPSHRIISSLATRETVVSDRIHEGSAVCQSAGLVAPQIGHRFTLVGSRPSGTS
jgi:hypothetical protein